MQDYETCQICRKSFPLYYVEDSDFFIIFDGYNYICTECLNNRDKNMSDNKYAILEDGQLVFSFFFV